MADNILFRDCKNSLIFPVQETCLDLLLLQPKPGFRLRLYLCATVIQSRSYGAMVSHITIVFTRYIILEWIRRNQNDQKSYGELFFMYCEDIQDMDLTNALQSLMALFFRWNMYADR